MKDSIAHIHSLCHDWKRELDFYKNEIPILKKRLEEVASRNTAAEIAISIEKFENKFDIIANHLNELGHDIKSLDAYVLNDAASKPTFIHIKKLDTPAELIDLMKYTANDFQETKKDFYQFVSAHL